MVTGKGEICGFWAVTEVSDTRSFFMDDGQARKIEFSLKLKYYGRDYQGSEGNIGLLSGVAARVDCCGAGRCLGHSCRAFTGS
jgi:phage protein U